MRFVQLCLALAAVVAIVNAAPATNNELELTNNLHNFDKRHSNPCCGGDGAGVKKDAAPAPAPVPAAPAPVPAAPAPVPAAPAPAPAPINRNDRVGDNVNVVVNANHA